MVGTEDTPRGGMIGDILARTIGTGDCTEHAFRWAQGKRVVGVFKYWETARNGDVVFISDGTDHLTVGIKADGDRFVSYCPEYGSKVRFIDAFRRAGYKILGGIHLG